MSSTRTADSPGIIGWVSRVDDKLIDSLLFVRTDSGHQRQADVKQLQPGRIPLKVPLQCSPLKPVTVEVKLMQPIAKARIALPSGDRSHKFIAELEPLTGGRSPPAAIHFKVKSCHEGAHQPTPSSRSVEQLRHLIVALLRTVLRERPADPLASLASHFQHDRSDCVGLAGDTEGEPFPAGQAQTQIVVDKVIGAPSDAVLSIMAWKAQVLLPVGAIPEGGMKLHFAEGPAGLNPFRMDLLMPLCGDEVVIRGMSDALAQTRQLTLRHEDAEVVVVIERGISKLRNRDEAEVEQCRASDCWPQCLAWDDPVHLTAAVESAREYLAKHRLDKFLLDMLTEASSQPPADVYAFAAARLAEAQVSLAENGSRQGNCACVGTNGGVDLDYAQLMHALSTNSADATGISHSHEEIRPLPAGQESMATTQKEEMQQPPQSNGSHATAAQADQIEGEHQNDLPVEVAGDFAPTESEQMGADQCIQGLFLHVEGPGLEVEHQSQQANGTLAAGHDTHPSQSEQIEAAAELPGNHNPSAEFEPEQILEVMHEFANVGEILCESDANPSQLVQVQGFPQSQSYTSLHASGENELPDQAHSHMHQPGQSALQEASETSHEIHEGAFPTDAHPGWQQLQQHWTPAALSQNAEQEASEAWHGSMFADEMLPPHADTDQGQEGHRIHANLHEFAEQDLNGPVLPDPEQQMQVQALQVAGFSQQDIVPHDGAEGSWTTIQQPSLLPTQAANSLSVFGCTHSDSVGRQQKVQLTPRLSGFMPELVPQFADAAAYISTVCEHFAGGVSADPPPDLLDTGSRSKVTCLLAMLTTTIQRMAVPSLEDLLAAELDRQEEQEELETECTQPAPTETRTNECNASFQDAVARGRVEGGSVPSFRLSVRWEKKASFQESGTSVPCLTTEHHTGAAASRNSLALLMQSSLPSITHSTCHKCFAAAQPQSVEPRPSKLDATNGDGAGTVTSASIAQRYGRPLSCGHDDASTHDDDRSPHTSLTATSGQAAQEPEALPRFSELLSQLDVDVMDTERQRAQAEAAAFEERQRQARHEAAQKAAEDEVRRVEAAREAWERHRMAAEESEERRQRANRHALELEEKMRKMVGKQSSKRRMQKEEEQRKRREEKDRRKEERLRIEAAKMSEKIRRMAESGYALGPSGWVRLDWLSAGGQADVGTPNFEVVKGPTEEEESDAAEDHAAADAHQADPFEVVDQRPVPEAEQKQPEPVSVDDVLADIDRQQREGWASGAEPGDLDTVLGILAADEERELAETDAVQVRQNYEELGEVENMEDELPPDATQSATKVLRVAKTRRPDCNFGNTINSESALKPFNDFVEEKQEGANSYEERQARSAAIQAKLQAARNRLSLVRYERSSTGPVVPATSQTAPAGAARKPQEQPKPKAKQKPTQLPQSRFVLALSCSSHS
ncbi:unnamed protein product [Symbiodinium sp. CCMP2456]|nr:unnamed protein product [Symbiodinium sp. CCMP2456]